MNYQGISSAVKGLTYYEDDLRIVPTTDIDYFEDDLYDCVISGKQGSFKEYLRKGLSPNHAFRSTERPERLGKTLLEVAIAEGRTEIVKILVDKKCDPNLLYVVNVKNFVYRMEEFRKRDRLKLTTMYRCIVKRDLPMIKFLVSCGFDVNMYDDRKCTALWHAVDLDDYEMLKLMTGDKNCDVNAPDIAKLRPLHVAAMRGNVKMASHLIQRGADVDSVQLRGSTPLILACRAANFETVRLLLLNGADPNHVGNNGHNVISTALQSTTDKRIPEMLIDCGACVDLELILLCKKEREKFILLDQHPKFMDVLKWCADTPRSLKTFCCLRIRRLLVQSHVKLDLIKKVEKLPLPRLIKDYILFGHV